MPFSTVRAFTEPDEYAAAIRGSAIEINVTQRGLFKGDITSIDLHRLWLQKLSDNLPRTFHTLPSDARATISFLSRPGSFMARNGLELDPKAIFRVSPGRDYFTRSSGFVAVASMSLPLDDMATISAAMIGNDLSKPNNHLMGVAPPPMMARLRRLHTTAVTLAEEVPEVIAQPDAARGLEQALIEAMMSCLGHGDVEEDRAALRQHTAIMRRFYRAIEQRFDEPLYMPELCKEIGTSLRTLHMCCQEHLGMSPKHFLLLRRMNLFRRVLRASTPDKTTVTETATRYGFWQFGRLAVEYKALFGESPSATLAQSVPRCN